MSTLKIILEEKNMVPSRTLENFEDFQKNSGNPKNIGDSYKVGDTKSAKASRTLRNERIPENLLVYLQITKSLQRPPKSFGYSCSSRRHAQLCG